ncbi:hypothetical protein V1524DRAFT_457712 [Lipomyces starkeyi]
MELPRFSGHWRLVDPRVRVVKSWPQTDVAWYLDSGATSHVCNDTTPRTIAFARKHSGLVYGHGVIALKLKTPRGFPTTLFCYSEVVYLDQFVPAASATLDSLTLAAASTVSGADRRPLLPYTILLRHLPAGGFGLFDLSTQLQGARAQWIRRLLFEPRAHSWAPLLRLLMEKRHAHRFRPGARQRPQPRPMAVDNRLSLTYPALTTLSPHFALARGYLRDGLPLRWRQCLDSWWSLVRIDHFPDVAELADLHHVRWTDVDLPEPLDWFAMRDHRTITRPLTSHLQAAVFHCRYSTCRGGALGAPPTACFTGRGLGYFLAATSPPLSGGPSGSQFVSLVPARLPAPGCSPGKFSFLP